MIGVIALARKLARIMFALWRREANAYHQVGGLCSSDFVGSNLRTANGSPPAPMSANRCIGNSENGAATDKGDGDRIAKKEIVWGAIWGLTE